MMHQGSTDVDEVTELVISFIVVPIGQSQAGQVVPIPSLWVSVRTVHHRMRRAGQSRLPHKGVCAILDRNKGEETFF
jgi:hypothetical protein